MVSRNVAIVGLGLMGGSLGLALRRRGVRVIGISRSREKLKDAARRRIISEGTTSLAKGVQDADVVFVATPVKTIPKIVFSIDRFARAGTVVTDVGSTKTEILKSISRHRFRNVRFVGSHPMAGSHKTGYKAARADLYKDACVFVIRDRATDKKALSKIVSFWRSVGARVQLISAEKHDRIAAAISQLPHLLAMTLVNVSSKEAMRFAGNGFLDTTRVAQGDPRLWLDIVRTNRRFLAEALRKFSRKLLELANVLKKDQKGKLLSALARARKIRSHIHKHER